MARAHTHTHTGTQTPYNICLIRRTWCTDLIPPSGPRGQGWCQGHTRSQAFIQEVTAPVIFESRNSLTFFLLLLFFPRVLNCEINIASWNLFEELTPAYWVHCTQITWHDCWFVCGKKQEKTSCCNAKFAAQLSWIKFWEGYFCHVASDLCSFCLCVTSVQVCKEWYRTRTHLCLVSLFLITSRRRALKRDRKRQHKTSFAMLTRAT